MTSIPIGDQKKVMVHYLRFISFVVGFLLSLAALGDHSLALADEGMVTLRNNDGIFKSDRELEDKTKMVDTTGNIWLRGRKMMKETKGTTRRGANYSAGKCVHGGEGESRLGCKLSDRRLRRRAQFVGLVPFSADYHRPGNHPPKNN